MEKKRFYEIKGKKEKIFLSSYKFFNICNVFLLFLSKENEKSDSEEMLSNSNNNVVGAAVSSSSSSSLISTNTNNKKDLLLRDQTLTFIQTISIFIRFLNTDNQKLDAELKEIMVALNNLIETIGTIDQVSAHSKLINKKVSELELLLNAMINELNKNHIENVINTALDLARNANELF